ncbi:MAG TPA: thiamine pyrophosphate-dependent enzyme [Methanoregulaceae archaeon]|nr:thiamine pyrophosphate-dependent enzyme [Methanoregulaceae archaeon]
MKGSDLISQAKNTWCPGCGNFVVQHALKDVLIRMHDAGHQIEKFVLVAGIGQHAKIFDFMNLNGFYSLHGRTIPVATGIRVANPDLKVLCIAGDGDCYAEGLDHLIFAAKRNVDITVIVNDNRVYGLTTGQFTPTSFSGFRGRSTPDGENESPLNPLLLVLSAGATFIARGYTGRREQLKDLIGMALEHRGFSIVEVLQICATYNDLSGYYNERVYTWDEDGVSDFNSAFNKAREWDYNTDARIGLGVLYRQDKPLFEESYPVPARPAISDRHEAIRKFLKERA